MLKKLEQWIEQNNLEYSNQKISCSKFVDVFNGFYTESFLQNAYFVVVDEIPKPDISEFREMGLADFFDKMVNDITYNDTYYILPHLVENLSLHFNELVHVAQWNRLGATAFIQRYIGEILKYGIADAPLEKMASKLCEHYSRNGQQFDVPSYVTENL
jgi:hypothetical protein